MRTKSTAWPSPQDYNEAIQNPHHNLIDSELQSGTVQIDRLGIPRPITGAFASVYKLRCDRADWAVRCFLREIPDTQWRYERISEFVMHDTLPYTVGFNFQPDGIKVNGIPYPILKMEWVEGETLDSFLRSRKRDLAPSFPDRFRKMCADLESAGIAHGDLQHGNIMVNKGELFLVDYDGMFVPSMAGSSSNELGHRNYQHPRRAAETFGPQLDNFSAWAIYISLQAMVKDKWIYERLGSGDDCLLFRRSDFIDPMNSCAFAALEFHPDPELVLLGKLLRFYLQQEVDDVLPLSAPLDHIPEMVPLDPDVPQTRAQQIELQELQPEIQEQMQANLNMAHEKYPRHGGTPQPAARSKTAGPSSTTGPSGMTSAQANPAAPKTTTAPKGLPPTASHKDLQEALQQLRAASGKLQENIKPKQTLSKPLPKLVVDPAPIPHPAKAAAAAAAASSAVKPATPPPAPVSAAKPSMAPTAATRQMLTPVEPELLTGLPRRVKDPSSGAIWTLWLASLILGAAVMLIGSEVMMSGYAQLVVYLMGIIVPLLFVVFLVRNPENSRKQWLAAVGRATVGQVIRTSSITGVPSLTYQYVDQRTKQTVKAVGKISADEAKQLVEGQSISILYDPGSSNSVPFAACKPWFTMPEVISSRDLDLIQGEVDEELTQRFREAVPTPETHNNSICLWTSVWFVVLGFTMMSAITMIVSPTYWANSPALGCLLLASLCDVVVGSATFTLSVRPWLTGQMQLERFLVESGRVAQGTILQADENFVIYEFAGTDHKVHRGRITRAEDRTAQVGDSVTVLYDQSTGDSIMYKLSAYRARRP